MIFSMIFGRVFGRIFGVKRPSFSRLMGFILGRFLDLAQKSRIGRVNFHPEIDPKTYQKNQSKNHLIFYGVLVGSRRCFDPKIHAKIN